MVARKIVWGSCYLGLVRTGHSSQAKLTAIKSVKTRYVRSFWHTHKCGLGLASQSMEVHPLPKPPQQYQHTDLVTF